MPNNGHGRRAHVRQNHAGNKNFSHNSKGKTILYCWVKSLISKHAAISSTGIRDKIKEGGCRRRENAGTPIFISVFENIGRENGVPSLVSNAEFCPSAFQQSIRRPGGFTRQSLNTDRARGRERSISVTARLSETAMCTLNSSVRLYRHGPRKEKKPSVGPFDDQADKTLRERLSMVEQI